MGTLDRMQRRWLLRLVLPIPLVLSLCLHFRWVDASTPVAPSQVPALLELKMGLEEENDTSYLSTWNAQNNCSTWLGLTCDENGFVIEINLYSLVSILPPTNYMNLGFDLPPFTLGSIQLSGTIPESIGNLTTLKKLTMSGNRLSGGIPFSISNLVNLEILDLSNNHLTGFIPPSISNLSKLYLLFLSYNTFTGPIPEELNNLTNLLSIDMGVNNLNGSIPDSLSSLTNLKTLILGSNDFSPSPFPSWIANMTHLQYLDIRGSNLEGSIPLLDKLVNLSFVDLSFNNLDGSIENQFSNSNALSVLILSTNSLTGTLPANLGKQSLISIDLSRNKISGGIPPDYFRSGNRLWNVDFSSNYLNGSIPPTISDLTSIFTLNLGSNQLTGAIPSEIAKMSALIDFFVDGNSLTGLIPDEIGNATSLTNLVLSSNQFQGPLPNSIGLLTKLRNLYVDSNTFSGQLPPEFGGLHSSLMVFDGSQNNFTGIIPPIYGILKSLTNLRLFRNSIQGYIPDLSNLTQLIELDLSFNKFTGPVPNNLNPSLIKLNLRSNSLFGSLPFDFLERLGSLITLDLSLNLLIGEPSFKNISKSLTFISLSPGQLTDNTPRTISVGNSTIPIFGTDCSVSNSSCFKKYSDYVDSPIQCDTRCNGLEEINPMLYALSQSCICSPPLIVEIQLYAPLFYVFNENESSHVKKYFAGITNFPEIRVKVKNATAIVNDQVTYNVFILFFTNDTKESIQILYSLYSSQGSRLDSSMVSRMDSSIGPYRVVMHLLPDKGVQKAEFRKQFKNYALIVSFAAFSAILLGITTLLLIIQIYGPEKEFGGVEEFMKKNITKSIKFAQVKKATKNFSEKLGAGGFSTVYKGVSETGQIWAVKRAKKDSQQDRNDFEKEVKLIARMNHKNIVRLLGYCDEQDERILVYEFMARGTLRNALNPRFAGKTQPVLTFLERLNIAHGAAMGLAYLHRDATESILHRDIKPENILLDERLRAKVADFGLLKRNSLDENISTYSLPVGTQGYMAPEYVKDHIVTEKSDVYSFGVVLMELLTGKGCPIFDNSVAQIGSNGYEVSMSKINITDWAEPYIKVGSVTDIIDPLLEERYDPMAAKAFAELAYDCVKEEASQRPNMASVADRLRKILKTVNANPAWKQENSSSNNKQIPKSSYLSLYSILYSLKQSLGSKKKEAQPESP